jgi:Zn-dependent peptidase ImmA (M78 family)
MTAIPKRVDVMGKTYKIELDLDDSSDYGLCVADRCTIKIAKRQCDMQKRDTLLHELTHAVDHELKLEMKENQVHRMATGLLAVFRHNPQLVAFLTADDD